MRPERKRQARGEQRMQELLDAAAEVFTEHGYKAAGTNEIARRAGASPGTLYQFFKNKEAIAEALMARYITRLRAAHGEAFDLAVAELPLDRMLDRIIDPLVTFDRANPGFYALMSDPHLSPELTGAKRPAQKLMFQRLDQILERRAPDLPAEHRTRTAEVAVHLFRGLLPLIMSASEEDLPTLVAETKGVLRDYLSPRIGAYPPRTTRAPAEQERARAAWANLRRMADEEGLFDFDRAIDLNKSVDDGLLRYAMEVLDTDSRADTITRALHETVAAHGAEPYRATNPEA